MMNNVSHGHERPVVCLDPGHFGKYNPGVVPGYYESEMNWKLHLLLKSELEGYGITVTTTRTDPERDLSLHERGRAAKGADLMLSVHSNAAGTPTPDYPLAICNVDGGSDAIGNALVEVVESLMNTVQPGRVFHKTASSGRGDWYTVLNASKAVGVPGVILEHSFHTNPTSCAWLMEEENLKELAKQEAAVIAEYFGMEKQTQPERIYRVRRSWEDAAGQIGAFSILENAINFCREGYTVYDWKGVPIFSKASYDLTEFVREVQKAVGASVDGIPGPETLGKTITVSASKNNRHAVVAPIQRRLYALGYTQVGEADGHAGPKFTAAVKVFQSTAGGYVDGEITAGQLTWKRLLDYRTSK